MLAALAALAWASSAEDAVRAAVAARLDVPLADVEVREVGLPAGAPADAAWDVRLPAAGPLCGTVPVVLRAGEGRWAVRPRVTVYAQVPVAAEAAKAGTRVRLTLERRPLEELRGEAPVDPSASWQARVPFAPGDPVTEGRVRPWPDALEGSAVQLVAGARGLSVTAPGRLIQDGFVGERVSALNLATRSVVVGTLGDDGRVHLEAP